MDIHNVTLDYALKHVAIWTYEQLNDAINGANFAARGAKRGDKAKFNRAARMFIAEAKTRPECPNG